jgi:hypothetical protein
MNNRIILDWILKRLFQLIYASRQILQFDLVAQATSQEEGKEHLIQYDIENVIMHYITRENT